MSTKASYRLLIVSHLLGLGLICLLPAPLCAVAVPLAYALGWLGSERWADRLAADLRRAEAQADRLALALHRSEADRERLAAERVAYLGSSHATGVN